MRIKIPALEKQMNKVQTWNFHGDENSSQGLLSCDAV
jgi:hypothetical protein